MKLPVVPVSGSLDSSWPPQTQALCWEIILTTVAALFELKTYRLPIKIDRLNWSLSSSRCGTISRLATYTCTLAYRNPHSETPTLLDYKNNSVIIVSIPINFIH
jgi:hypothetical protein